MLLLSILAPFIAPSAQASIPDVTATVPAVFVLPNFTNGVAGDYLLSGYSVNGDSSKDYLVGISLTGGSSGDYLKLTTTTGLTASYGYTSGANIFSSFTEITFTGSITSINSVLSASFKYRSSAGAWPTPAPSIKLTITENVPGIAYYAKDDHYYKIGHFMATAGDTPTVNQQNFVFCSDSDAAATSYRDGYSSIETLTIKAKGNSSCTWTEANRLARNTSIKGRPGYLANVTSLEENNFLKDKLQGALNVWMGGTDGASDGSPSIEVATSLTSTPFDYMSNDTLTAYSGGTEGLWHFYDGPEAGKIFWRYKGIYSCGGYSAGNVNTQARWLDFRSKCETAGYNISGGTPANNYDAVAYSNWANLEPNNSSTPGTGEDNVVFNWTTADGFWNDLQSDEGTVSFYGYIIEYGDATPFSGVSRAVSTLNKVLNITFDANNGSGTMSSITTRSESNTVLTGNVFTRTGYSFDGWADSSSGSAAYNDSATVAFTADKTLYAHWSANTNNSITYDNQGATTAQTGGSSTYTTNAAIVTIPTTPPTKSGYTFTGWFTSSSSGTQVTDGSYTPPSPYGSITLYAQWSANSSGGGYYRAPAPVTTIIIPPEPTAPVIVDAPKASAPSNVQVPRRKISVSRTPAKTIIAIAPQPAQKTPLISLGSSDIAIKGLNANEYIRVTILDKNGNSQVVTGKNDSELSSIVNRNPKSALSIEITPTLNSKLKKGARVGVNGAKSSDRVRVILK